MWMNAPESEMERIIASVKDQNLKLFLAFGIGIHHAGLVERDRKTVEELYVNRKAGQIYHELSICLMWSLLFPDYGAYRYGHRRLGRQLPHPFGDYQGQKMIIFTFFAL